MNTNSIDSVIASLRNARSEIKATAAAARLTAPKGQKMVVGQHATATAAAAIAAAAVPAIVAAGWVAASVTVNKSGTDIAVHYRAPQTLAQRVEKWEAAAAKRKAIRDAKRAAKEAAKAPVVPVSPASTALAQLDALLNRKAA